MQQLTKNNFKDIITNDKYIVVDFWASWCGPCKMLAPVFEKVAEKFGGKAIFAKVDVDEESDIAAEYNIFSIPTIIMFKGGNEIARRSGYMSENELENFINSNIN